MFEAFIFEPQLIDETFFSSRLTPPHYCRSHLCIARFFFTSYFTAYEFYIFVDDIILHYACTTFHVPLAFALFIIGIFHRGIRCKNGKKPYFRTRTL